MDIKLLLKFLTYISRLQIVLDVLNFSNFFHMELFFGQCLLFFQFFDVTLLMNIPKSFYKLTIYNNKK
jgi:hypothetical protein